MKRLCQHWCKSNWCVIEIVSWLNNEAFKVNNRAIFLWTKRFRLSWGNDHGCHTARNSFGNGNQKMSTESV